jgi:hypothetical protein
MLPLTPVFAYEPTTKTISREGKTIINCNLNGNLID